MGKRTVRAVAFKHASDFNLAKPISGRFLDELVGSCLSRATVALKQDVSGYRMRHRHQMSDVLEALLYSHRAIRHFLKDLTANDPEAVDMLSLLRLQFEYLFTICLMLEDRAYVDAYIEDYWRKRYVQYLFVREECSSLPSHQQFLTESPVWLTKLRDYFGITPEQQATIDFEELGTPLPDGMRATSLRRFPTPGKVRDLTADPDKKRMLERLYVEYEYLCSFAHGLPEANLLKGIFDPHARHRVDPQVTDANIGCNYRIDAVVPE